SATTARSAGRVMASPRACGLAPLSRFDTPAASRCRSIYRVEQCTTRRRAMAADTPEAFDLDAYLRRIEYAGERRPTRAALEAVHLAHATHIPFENLDILLGKPIRLDIASVQAKLVHGRRGGYCFEQNQLLAAALEAFGFPVTRLAARVRLGATRVLPRTHMLLAVEVEGTRYLADVGFGGGGPLLPLPLDPRPAVRQVAWASRVPH